MRDISQAGGRLHETLETLESLPAGNAGVCHPPACQMCSQKGSGWEQKRGGEGERDRGGRGPHWPPSHAAFAYRPVFTHHHPCLSTRHCHSTAWAQWHATCHCLSQVISLTSPLPIQHMAQFLVMQNRVFMGTMQSKKGKSKNMGKWHSCSSLFSCRVTRLQAQSMPLNAWAGMASPHHHGHFVTIVPNNNNVHTSRKGKRARRDE